MALRLENGLALKGTPIALKRVVFVRRVTGRHLWVDLPEAMNATKQATARREQRLA
jgi:hypothetical protein